jgi:uncharacterized membrane protein YhaH (DUF805 family)
MTDAHVPGRAMTFGQSIATVFRKYADFSGRASMSEFWWFFLFSALVGSGLSTIDIAYLGGSADRPGLTTLWSLATLLPSLAVSVRRLRDGGNKWAQMFWLLVPIAGLVVLILRWCDPPRDIPVGEDAAGRTTPSLRPGP